MITILRHSWTYLSQFKYHRHSSVGLVILVLVVLGGFFGYGRYRADRQAQAQKIFSESYELFEQALAAQLSKEKVAQAERLWQEAVMAFQTGYQRYSDTALAPFFLGFQAEIAVQQGNVDQALELMDTMLSKLSRHEPLYDMYLLKRVLMQFDASREEYRQNALKQLMELAQHEGPAQDAALYYLGEYYWSVHELDKARQTWLQLQELGRKGKQPIPSPWEEKIADRLEQTRIAA
jgi:tetratricopeptide (TPR) repeat protein